MSNIELAQNLIHRLVVPLPSKSLHLRNGRDTGRRGRGLNGYIQEPEWSVIKRQEKASHHQSECRTCIDRIVFVEDRAFNDQRYAVDSTKLVGLGWSPSVDYEQGIVNTSKCWSTVVNDLRFLLFAVVRSIVNLYLYLSPFTCSRVVQEQWEVVVGRYPWGIVPSLCEAI